MATVQRPIVDYNDNKLGLGQVAVDVARCIVKDAKPKAKVTWEFESDREYDRLLSPLINNFIELKVDEEVTVDYPDANKQKYGTTSTLKIVPQAHYNNQIVKCRVSHVELGKDIV